jgi:ArsR family transcriptional regulator, arsenate/arsenite/antimonite-responsive transcriptional repressor
MGTSKTEEYTFRQNRLAAVAKALAHPARIAIVEYLAKTNACMCGDIVEVLPLSQSTVSQHLRELKNAGLIKGEVEGTSVCYCVDERGWAEAKEIFGMFLTNVQKCC